MHPKEVNLLQGIEKDDPISFKILFDKYYSELCQYALYQTNDLDIAEEIVQDLFVKIWEHRKTIKINTSVKSYLKTATSNSCKNYFSHLKVKKKYQDYQMLNGKKYISKEQVFTDPFLEERIYEAISKLPSKCRQIFEMNRFKGYKYKEISRELNISPKTVEAQIGKALKTLYISLKDYLPLYIILISY